MLGSQPVSYLSLTFAFLNNKLPYSELEMPESTSQQRSGTTYSGTRFGPRANAVLGDVHKYYREYGSKILFCLKIIAGILGLILFFVSALWSYLTFSR